MATTETPTRTARTFRRDIQGLRAIAVVAVLAYHASVPIVSGGYVGVDIFFVISGFLISGHLVDSVERTGRIHFADFYAKRARRILPASLLVVAISAGVALFVYPPVALLRTLSDAAVTAVYIPNIVFARRGVDYLANDAPSLFQHYWSLGVEEQFYLFWPLLILLIWKVWRSYRGRLIAMATLVAASFVAGALLTTVDQPWAFFMLPTRAWQLGVGALVALIVTRPGLTVRRRWVAAVAGWVGMAIMLGTIVGFNDDTIWPGYAALWPTIGSALVIYAGTAAPASTSFVRLLSLRPVVYIGTISYSLYLVHWPILILAEQAFGPLRLRYTVALALLAVPVAALLYRYVETPLRHLPALTSRRPRVTLVATGVASIVLIGAAVISTAVVRNQPLSTAGLAVTLAPTAPPDATTAITSTTRPSLWDVTDDNTALHNTPCFSDKTTAVDVSCVFGDTSSAKTVVMFGDSHMAQWFPALDPALSAAGFKLITMVRPGCPVATVPTIRFGSVNTACDEWRSNVVKWLGENPPDVILLATTTNQHFADKASDGDADVWQDAWLKTLNSLPSRSRVALIADTPRLWGEEPVDCLAENTAAALTCAVDRATALKSDFRTAEREAARSAQATVIDLTDYICDTDRCYAVISNRIAYRDPQHLTGTFAAALSQAFADKLAPVLRSTL